MKLKFLRYPRALAQELIVVKELYPQILRTSQLVSRAIVKVRGQYHIKKTYDELPKIKKDKNETKAHIGLIGCGNYAFSNIAYYLNRRYKNVVRACMDKNIHAAASLYEEYGLEYYTDDADVMRLIEYKRREIELTGRLPVKRVYDPGAPDGRVRQYD